MLSKKLLILFFTILSGQLFAEDTLVLYNDKGIKKIKQYMTFYCDTFDNKTIEEILKVPFYKASDKEDYFNFNFQDKPFWFKVCIKNASAIPINQYLEINRAYFPVADLYEFDGDGNLSIVKSGSSIKFKNRPVNFNTLTFDLRINPSETKVLYLQLKTKGLTLVFRPQLYEPQKLFKSNWSLNLYYGSYFGVLMIVLINSLFLFYVEKRIEFMYYFGMVFSAMIVNAFYSGYLLRVIQNFPLIEAHYKIYGLGAFLASFAGTLFTVKFLNLKEVLPKFYKFLMFTVVFSAIMFIATLFVPYKYVTKFSFFYTVIVSFLASCSAILAYRKGDKTARFFMVGYLLLCLGIALYGMRVYNVIPENNFTIHTFELGSMLEMIFLFLALSDKQNVLKKRYETVQEERNASNEQSNEALRNLVHEQTDILTEAETRISQQNLKTKQLESELANLAKLQESAKANNLLNRMIYANLKNWLNKLDRLLSKHNRAFYYYKSHSDYGNAFVFGTEVHDNIYIICAENDLDVAISSTLNTVTRSFFYNIILEKSNISPADVLREIHYYYKSQIQEADLDDRLEIRIGVLKLQKNMIEFASAGESIFVVHNDAVEKIGDTKTVLGTDELPKDYAFFNYQLSLEKYKGAYIYLPAWGMMQEKGGFAGDSFGEPRMMDALKNSYMMHPDDQKNSISQLYANWLLQGETVQKYDWFLFGFEFN
jgi:two-component system, sensor histidine kinase LadS